MKIKVKVRTLDLPKDAVCRVLSENSEEYKVITVSTGNSRYGTILKTDCEVINE